MGLLYKLKMSTLFLRVSAFPALPLIKVNILIKDQNVKMHFPKMTFACGQALLVALLDNVNQSHLNEKLSNMWMILQVLSLSCFLRCSRILISSCACRWNRFSFRTIFKATCWCVLWSYTLSTCPNDPFPITFRISYLGKNKIIFCHQEYSPDDELN